jgi:hypothetical protein
MARVKFSASATGIVLGLALAVLPSTGRATTYVQTSDHCSGDGCGTVAGNTIEVTQNVQAGTTTFTVNLAPGWAFVDTGANGGGASLNFGFASSLTNVSILNTSSNGWNATAGQFQVQDGAGLTNPTTVSTGVVQAPAANGNTFSFANGIAILCNTNGGSSSCGNSSGVDLSFTISTLVSLVGDATAGAFFWADVINTNRTGSPTGLIDFGPGTSTVPLPPAMLLFGTALAGLGILGRRRKKALALPLA